MNGLMVSWYGTYHSNETLDVQKNKDTCWPSCEVVIRVKSGDLRIMLTHDQAWHLRDDLNTILADGCPTTVDVEGLHADAHAALSACERVCERVGLNKVKGTDAAITS